MSAADQLAELGKDAAREAWAEHGGDLDAVPHSPELRPWARAGHVLGLLESDRELTEPEQRVFVHAYRGELHRLAAASAASARAADAAVAPATTPLVIFHASREKSEITQVFGSMHASSAYCPSGTSPRGPSDGASTPTRDQLFHGAVAMALASEQEADPSRREALEVVAAWLSGLYIAGGAR